MEEILTQKELYSYALNGVQAEISSLENRLRELRMQEDDLKKKFLASTPGPTIENIRRALKRPPKKSVPKQSKKKFRSWTVRDRKAASERMKKYWKVKHAETKQANKT